MRMSSVPPLLPCPTVNNRKKEKPTLQRSLWHIICNKNADSIAIKYHNIITTLNNRKETNTCTVHQYYIIEVNKLQTDQQAIISSMHKPMFLPHLRYLLDFALLGWVQSWFQNLERPYCFSIMLLHQLSANKDPIPNHTTVTNTNIQFKSLFSK